MARKISVMTICQDCTDSAGTALPEAVPEQAEKKPGTDVGLKNSWRILVTLVVS